MDKENGENSGGDKNKGGHASTGGAPDPNSLLDAASLFGKCFSLYIFVSLCACVHEIAPTILCFMGTYIYTSFNEETIGGLWW